MTAYEPGQKAIYQEDGASAIVEVMARNVEGDLERYKLKVIKPLNTSNPKFVGSEGTDDRALRAAEFIRGFSLGQELNVGRNINATGTPTWGMWTLTDIVEDAPRPNH